MRQARGGGSVALLGDLRAYTAVETSRRQVCEVQARSKRPEQVRSEQGSRLLGLGSGWLKGCRNPNRFGGSSRGSLGSTRLESSAFLEHPGRIWTLLPTDLVDGHQIAQPQNA